MRFREFLIEYSRAKTAEMVGDKLILALGNERRPPVNLTSIRDSIKMGPSWWNADPDRMKIWTDAILGAIEDKDPTPNKAYTPWLARMYAKGGLKLEDINRNDLLGLYDIAKKRRMLKPEHNDINSFKTYKDFEDMLLIGGHYNLDDIQNSNKKEEKGQASKVYEDSDVVVIVPQDEAAACRYGRGTRWCTASTRGQNYFDHYNRQGRMYILLPKNPEHEGEKYQLHFQSQQYMNEDDDQVNLVNLISKRFPNLLEFFLAIPNSGLKGDLRFTDPEVIQDVLDKIREVGNDWISEKVNDAEADDYDYYHEMAERYPDPDEEGSVDWDAVHKAGDDYLQYNDYLKELVDGLTTVLETSVDDIKEYVNDEPFAGLDSFEIRNIPNIIEEIALYSHYGYKKNTMFTEFFKHLDVVRKGDEWQARAI
jgi:hypothetical protein